MKLHIKLAAICSLALFTACEDKLNLYPEDSVSEETFFNNVTDLELFANGFYGLLPGAQGPGADDQSDCYVNEKPNTWLFNQEIKPTSGGGWGSGDWGNIRSLNFFMQRYTKASGREDEINAQIAVIRFFRAWEYFYKVRRFGDVPWYETDLNIDSPELYNGRDNRKTVFTHMLEDIDFAIEHLPSSPATGRLHKYAALAYKSRICLYEASFRKYHGLGDYEELYRECAEACEEIMESDRYEIYSNNHPEKDYYNLFVQEDLAGNSECIMPRVYEAKLLTHNNTRQMEESYTGMSRAMFEQYLCADGLPTAVSPTYGGEAELPGDEVLKRDPRLAQSIDNPTLPFKLKGDGTPTYNNVPSIDTKYCTTGYHVMKYHSPEAEQWNIGLSTLDVFIFRYAEVLLNYAEAKAELGECDDDVLDRTVNRLRDRVEMPHLKANVGFTDPNWPDYGYTLTPLLYEIRRERAVELLGEGFRWDDIVRWKAGRLLENPKSMLGMKVTDKLREQYDDFNRTVNEEGFLVVYPDKSARVWDDKLYLHPIPIEETIMNPNLLPNNPGWE